MNTYDPADGIVYVHLARDRDRCSGPQDEDRACAALPAGYANESPSTALRIPRSQLRKPAPGPASPPSRRVQGGPGEVPRRTDSGATA